MRVVLFSPRLLVNCPLVPHCSPLFLTSLPSGFPRNPNVLLIRTHPNPFPSVANSYTKWFKMYLLTVKLFNIVDHFVNIIYSTETDAFKNQCSLP
jgi:hypothetical protein